MYKKQVKCSTVLHLTVNWRSDCLLHIPHKGAETEHLVVIIDLLQSVEERLYLMILHDGEDGAVH